MSQAKQLETLEVVQASSKETLYEELNDRFNNYRIVEETKKTKFPFFWKADYAVKVMVPSKVQIQMPESFSKQLEEKITNEQAETTEELGLSDEEVIHPISHGLKLSKKREMLRKLDQVSTSSPIETKKLTVKKEQEEEIGQLKEMLAVISDKLGEKQTVESPNIEKIARILRDSGFEEAYIKSYLKRAETHFQAENLLSDAAIHQWLVNEMQEQIKTKEKLDITENRIIALAGQTGVGKTTTLVKLGWQLSNRNRSVGFITTDTFRSGAVQQLEGYAEKMGIELIVADGPEELQEAIGYFTHVHQVDHILIDTVGRNYMSDDSIEIIKEYLEVAKPDLACLTFSAVYKSKDMLEIASKFHEDEIDGFIFTKIDETKTIGGLFSLFMETSKPALFLTDGQDITKNISIANSELLARLMVFKDEILEGIM